MNAKTAKIFSAITAIVISLCILSTGTLAWQSITQQATNELKSKVANPGGRLHDDFDGSNKDIYVENFTDDKTGLPIYARVRLREYLEIGKGVGDKNKPNRDVTVIGKKDADISDTNTWLIHRKVQETEQGETFVDDDEIHKYWKWDIDQEAPIKYMPTFDKNKDSIKADINGTFAGTDGNRHTNEDRYKDYIDYSKEENATKTDDAIYDLDDNDVDEGDQAVKDENFTTKQETHTVKNTAKATVITMQQWKDMGSPIGDYWVYDKDGWAYYAKAIMPGTASGLLLDGITPTDELKDKDWYYGIKAEAEFATNGDWGDKDKQTGFHKNGVSKEALQLLNKITGQQPHIEHISIVGGTKQTVKALESKAFEVDINVQSSLGDDTEKQVTWSIEPYTDAFSNNVFTPTEDMIGKTYTIKATSTLTPHKFAYVDVLVEPKEAVVQQLSPEEVN